ncbi:hypothetical protein SCP_0902420 [Sparassis crispa]|uniref:RanBP2-type domain-containing protein n=1 Tax=Sparassis crispa TaxID=139825 RepID=A0A401GVZ8_9APHY|nr:hypothetical protein SCP_0902420 [Sparassis crispa]GBE86363.1 hypothetical protein SCP_0902420 [Sparassis crispa]
MSTSARRLDLTASRRQTRTNNSSPYSRNKGAPKPDHTTVTAPAPTEERVPLSKKWSLTGLLGFLNPFASRPEPKATVASDSDAARNLAERGNQLANGVMARTHADEQEAMETHIDPAPTPAPEPDPEIAPAPAATPAPAPAPSANSETISPADAPMDTDASSVPPTLPPADEPRTTAENLATVQAFLTEKGGKPLNAVELAGIVSLLNNSVEGAQPASGPKPEPFRFSESPSSPGRGDTPILDFTSPGTAPSGQKVLTKNPNGMYRLQGGGTARPRNRYHSPAFGPSRSAPTMTITPEKFKTDTKRRRVGQDAATSSPQRVPVSTSMPLNGAAGPSAPFANGASISTSTSASAYPFVQPNGTARTRPAPRLNTPVKPTTPARPSPLRQTWNGSPPSPPQPRPTSKPTRAASFMTELIKEVTPPKKPDLVNPYQAASFTPMRPLPQKQPTRKAKAAATAPPSAASTSNAKPPLEKKESQLSQQAIIEATVPKGYKRSRPPPNLKSAKSQASTVTSASTFTAPSEMRRPEVLETQSSRGANGASLANAKRPYQTVVEEVEDEDAPPSPPKKQRTNGASTNGRAAPPPVTIEEVDDVDIPTAQRPGPPPIFMHPSEVVEPSSRSASSSTASPMYASGAGSSSVGVGLLPTAARSMFGNIKSSAPKAPSKLRYVIQAEREQEVEEVEKITQDKEEPGNAGVDRVPPPALTAPSSSFGVSGFSSYATPGSSSFGKSGLPLSAKPGNSALAAAGSSPFGTTSSSSFAAPSSSSFAGPGTSSFSPPVASSSTAPGPFSFGAPKLSSFKVPESSPFGTRSSSSSTAPAFSPFLTREASSFGAPAFPSTSAISSFKPVKPSMAVDARSTAMEVHEFPPYTFPGRQVGPSLSKPLARRRAMSVDVPSAPAFEFTSRTSPKVEPIVGFNWTAAGLKPPPKPAAGSWACSLCMVNNTGGATKCIACDTPR